MILNLDLSEAQEDCILTIPEVSINLGHIVARTFLTFYSIHNSCRGVATNDGLGEGGGQVQIGTFFGKRGITD